MNTKESAKSYRNRRDAMLDIPTLETRECVIIWHDDVQAALKAGSISQRDYDWLLYLVNQECFLMKIVNPLI
jgi:hypothetical protein